MAIAAPTMLHCLVMKVAPILAMSLLACGCSGPSPVSAAQECVRAKLGAREYYSATERQITAGQCDAQITAWALASTRYAFGSKFDPRNVEVRQEYALRKRGI